MIDFRKISLQNSSYSFVHHVFSISLITYSY